MSFSRSLIKSCRVIHLYLGLFISPALLFFAFTGAMQTAGLHEQTRGSNYKPPVWLAKMGQLHKKQTLVLPERRPQQQLPPPPANKPGDAAGGHGGSATPAGPSNATTAAGPTAGSNAGASLTITTGPIAKPNNLVPMKAFFLLVSLGLFVSTLTGVYMAYRYARRKTAITVTLVAGLVVPLLLLLI